MYKTASKNMQHVAAKGGPVGFSEATITVCRNILEGLAKSGGRITYGDFAEQAGISHQSLEHCVNAIREKEKNALRPDLTVILHYAKGRYGKVIPKNRAGFRAYKEELRKVYKYWGGSPGGALQAWLGL
jgi:hypothetical protein